MSASPQVPEDAAPEGALRERQALRASAEFLARLLLVEVDERTLDTARDPTIRTALGELGIEFPAREEQQAWLEERAAEFHELFLRPASGPLVQSIWEQGRYGGDAWVRVRHLARRAGFEFQGEAARGAAHDHLGSLLLLWVACDSEAQEVAGEITRAHFAWALAPLARIQSTGGFYGAVAGAVRALLDELGVPSRPGERDPFT